MIIRNMKDEERKGRRNSEKVDCRCTITKKYLFMVELKTITRRKIHNCILYLKNKRFESIIVFS